MSYLFSWNRYGSAGHDQQFDTLEQVREHLEEEETPESIIQQILETGRFQSTYDLVTLTKVGEQGQ